MTTIPTALANAYGLLRQDLYGHLDNAEYVVTKVTDWNERDAKTARRLIPDLVDVIRAALLQHDAGWYGRCRVCHATWPCATVQSIHQIVKDPAREIAKLFDTED
jgi:hypothetical protein